MLSEKDFAKMKDKLLREHRKEMKNMYRTVLNDSKTIVEPGIEKWEIDREKKVDYAKNKINSQYVINPNSKVIVTRMNHLIEVQHMQTMNFQARIKMLPRNEDTGYREYEVISTGEVHQFIESENRAENKNSLRQTFKKLRYLINNNFTGNGNELHVTLTYAEEMKDRKRLMEDFEDFIKRLRYKFKGKAKLEYINVVEPHASGKWHCHTLIRFDGLESVFIKNEEMAKIWRQGFVTIKSLKQVDNIGAYLSAYLTDIEVTDEDITGDMVVTREVDGEQKKFLKGGRLHFYDAGMNLYRKSQGMVYPTRETVKFKDIKKEVGHREPHFTQRIAIEQDTYSNEITYLQYNLKRQ